MNTNDEFQPPTFLLCFIFIFFFSLGRNTAKTKQNQTENNVTDKRLISFPCSLKQSFLDLYNLSKFTKLKFKQLKRDFEHVQSGIWKQPIKLCPFIFQIQNSAKIHHILAQKAQDTSISVDLCLELPLLLPFPLPS